MNGPKPILPVDEKVALAIRHATIERISQGKHDAIVVGGGASGGLAAALLTEAGLKVLLLDAEWRKSVFEAPFYRATTSLIQLLANPAAIRFLPPALIWKGQQLLKRAGHFRQPVQTDCYAWERLPEAFADDRDIPYATTDETNGFRWLRTQMLGGRMFVPGHGRQYYRLAPQDFQPDDELSPKWPVSYDEMVPWYEKIERRLALSGRQEGNEWLPDSVITNHLTPSEPEAELMAAITGRWPAARSVLGRYAPPLNTLQQAAETGNLLCRRGAKVRKILTDNLGHATGVTWHDMETGREQTAEAPLVFLGASPLESARILMMSKPGGLGNRSGHLGRYLMDHVMQKAEGIGGQLVGDNATPEQGHCVFLPRFDLRDGSKSANERGFGVQVYQAPGQAGESWFTAVAFGEMLPRAVNRIALDPDRTDAWGAPTLRIHCEIDEHETQGSADRARALKDLADIAGAKLNRLDVTPVAPGLAAHECGTARMGDHPDQSVLDPFNQCWEAQGLYVTDAASFVSQGYANPTLTIMALTARACAHALANAGVKPDTQETASPTEQTSPTLGS